MGVKIKRSYGQKVIEKEPDKIIMPEPVIIIETPPENTEPVHNHIVEPPIEVKKTSKRVTK